MHENKQFNIFRFFFLRNVSFERFILIVYIWRKKITVKHSAQKPELKMNANLNEDRVCWTHFETIPAKFG
jgi:hypothetical protein